MMSPTSLDYVAEATPKPVARRLRGLSDRAIAWIFIAPTIALLLAINIFPLIWTVRLSFTNFRANQPNAPVEFVGLRNYVRILTDEDIWMTMQATAHFVIWTLVLAGADRLRAWPGSSTASSAATTCGPRSSCCR